MFSRDSDQRIITMTIPLLYAINTEINPPYARDTKHRPEDSFVAEGANGKP